MKFDCLLFLGVAMCALCVAARNQGRIPCTYSAKIALQVTHNQYFASPRKYAFNFTQYSIEDQVWAQRGLIPMADVHRPAVDVFVAP